MIVSCSVVIYICHVAACIYMVVRTTKLWRTYSPYRFIFYSMIILPLTFSLIRAMMNIASSYIILNIFTLAKLRVTKASMISMGFAQGLLNSHDALGKNIALLGDEDDSDDERRVM